MTNGIGGQSLLVRLRRIEGQLRGIQRMLEEGRECEDVLTQLLAARNGLDQVGFHLMDHHVEHCLLSGPPDDIGAALRNLQRTLRVWLRFGGASAAEDEPSRTG